MRSEGVGLNILAFIAVIAFLYFTKTIFTPLLLSCFLFFLLDPIIVRGEKLCIPRLILSPVLITISVGVLCIIGWLAYVTTAEIAIHVPEYSAKVKNLINFFISKADKIMESTTQIFPMSSSKETVQKVELVHSVGDMTSYFFRGLDSFLGMVGSSFIVPLLTLLLLVEKGRMKEKMKALFSTHARGEFLAKKTAEVVQGFFVGNLTAGVASSLVFFGVFAWIGLNNKIALAIGSGFFSLIPVIGPFAAVVFPLAQGLLQFSSAGPFLAIGLASLLIHLFIGNLILPKVMGSRVDLNVVAATIGMLVWGWLWGPIGIFLAVPLTAVLKIAFSMNDNTRFLADALSETDKSPTVIVIAKSLGQISMTRGFGNT